MNSLKELQAHFVDVTEVNAQCFYNRCNFRKTVSFWEMKKMIWC